VYQEYPETPYAIIINNSTIVFNNDSGLNGAGFGGLGLIRNSIIFGNLNIATPDDVRRFRSGGNNVVGVFPDWFDEETDITGDPLLGPLQDNGGFAPTHALMANSPAINAGNSASCEATDQNGVERPQGEICDIGAVEYQYTPFVAPSDLTTSAIAYNSVTLQWNDNSADETAFNVERSLAGMNNWSALISVGANITTYDDISVTCGETYDYRVRAFRDSDSAFSSPTTLQNVNIPSCPVVDLALSMQPAPNIVASGNNLTYMLTLTNIGQLDAHDVIVSNVLPTGVSFVSASPSPACAESSLTVTCTLGVLNKGANSNISIEVMVTATEGMLVNTATATTSDPEPNTTNNSVQTQSRPVEVTMTIVSEQETFLEMQNQIATNPDITTIDFVVIDYIHGGAILTVRTSDGILGEVRIAISDSGGFARIEYLSFTVAGSPAPPEFVESIANELPLLIIDTLDVILNNKAGTGHVIQSINVTQTGIEVNIAN
jgi:uncharacterized repeat protein (TIGR01451 family)